MAINSIYSRARWFGSGTSATATHGKHKLKLKAGFQQAEKRPLRETTGDRPMTTTPTFNGPATTYKAKPKGDISYVTMLAPDAKPNGDISYVTMLARPQTTSRAQSPVVSEGVDIAA